MKYTISFSDSHAYFSIPKQADGLEVIGVPYRARAIRPGSIYLTHWMVPGRTGHVALIFDLEEKRVDAAALMPGMMELFDRATFDVMSENGENALYTAG